MIALAGIVGIRTVTYCSIVAVHSAITGIYYGWIMG